MRNSFSGLYPRSAMSLSQSFGRTIFTVLNPPPGTQSSLFLAGSPVTMNALFPSIMAGTVSMLSLPVHLSHGGVAVERACSDCAMRCSWRESG